MAKTFPVRKSKFARAGRAAGVQSNSGWRCGMCGLFYRLAKKFMPAQCRCGGMEFDHFHSESEAKRYGQLLLKVKFKQITNLRKQVSIPLHSVNPDGLKEKVCVYKADFTYNRLPSNERVIEDHKGLITDVFKLKKMWVKIEYGEDILLTK